MSEENVELARRWIALSNARDLAGIGSLLAADIVCFPRSDQPEAAAFRGRDAFIRYAEPWLEAFEPYAIDVSEYIDLGEHVVVVGRITARGRESGIETAVDEAWLMRFRNGEATEYRECGTRADALEAAAAAVRE